MSSKNTEALRKLGVSIAAQGSIVVAMAHHQCSAVRSGDQALYDLLQHEINRAQAKIRKLATRAETTDPGPYSELRSQILGCSDGVRLLRLP